MKLNQFKLLILIVLFISLFDLTLSNTKILRKHTVKQQKHYNQAEAKKDPILPLKNTLQQQLVYTQDTRTPSQAEEYPDGFKIHSPFTREQEDKLFPKKIYSKDQNNYNMNEATPENIGDNKVLLVKNITAAKEQFKNTKYFDTTQQLDPIAKNVLGDDFQKVTQPKVENLPPIYKNDQRAYYNPIDEKNIYKKNQNEGLYVVPIALQQNNLDDQFNKEQENRLRLHRRDKYYYDSSALYDAPNHDPIVQALADNAKLKAEPKAVGYNQWVKSEEDRQQKIQTLLGNPQKPYFVDDRTNVVTNQIKTLDINFDRAKADQNPLPQIKNNEQGYYYDAGTDQTAKKK